MQISTTSTLPRDYRPYLGEIVEIADPAHPRAGERAYVATIFPTKRGDRIAVEPFGVVDEQPVLDLAQLRRPSARPALRPISGRGCRYSDFRPGDRVRVSYFHPRGEFSHARVGEVVAVNTITNRVSVIGVHPRRQTAYAIAGRRVERI